MSLVWFSNETPDRDGQGGQRRQFFQIQALVQAGIQVTVLSLAGPQSGASVGALAPTIRVDAPRRGEPVSRWARRTARRCPAGEVRGVVIAHEESWALGAPLARRWAAPAFVDLHNVLSLWYAGRGAVREARRWRRVERAVAMRADRVAVCADREARHVTTLTGRTDLLVLEHGVDPSEWGVSPRRHPADVVRLFGNWSWDPNRAGLDWFCDEVWPDLRARHPELACEVAGHGVDRGLPDGVRACGRVPSVADFLSDALAVAVPVVGGVGAPVKFAEAVASGVPVLATADGAHGSSLMPELVSDDPGQWRRTLGALLGDGAAARARAADARLAALSEGSWECRSGPLVAWARHLERDAAIGDGRCAEAVIPPERSRRPAP